MAPVYAPEMPIGTALRRLRKAHHMTQAELAMHSGLAQRTIERLERRQHERPKNRTLRALAHAFGLSIEQVKYELGLAGIGAKRPDLPATLAPQVPSTYGQRVDRLALMFLNLTPSQQDYLESVALALHSQRHQLMGRKGAASDAVASTGKEEHA